MVVADKYVQSWGGLYLTGAFDAALPKFDTVRLADTVRLVDAALPTTGFLDNLFGVATDAAKLQTCALNVTKFYSARGPHILAATLTNLSEHTQGPSVGRVD
ncbi:MAG: hypothetical protein ACRDRS_19645 [Pseudonocardiaceae bacterium]